MNLANKLTVFRMVLVPILVIIPFLNLPGEWLGISTSFWVMDAIFILASLTDKLDGYIARSRNLVTTFGKFLDPLADKILVLSALVMLVEFGRMPAWIPVIVLAREFIVSGYRLVAVEKGGKVVAASIWGKLKTATQMVAIILAFLDTNAFFAFANEAVRSSMSTGHFILNVGTSILMAASVVATIFSGWDYLKDSKELFKGSM